MRDLHQVAGGQRGFTDCPAVDTHAVAAFEVAYDQAAGSGLELGVFAGQPRVTVGDVAAGIRPTVMRSRTTSSRWLRPSSRTRRRLTAWPQLPDLGDFHGERDAPGIKVDADLAKRGPTERHDAQRVPPALVEHGVAIEQPIAERRSGRRRLPGAHRQLVALGHQPRTSAALFLAVLAMARVSASNSC